VWSLHDQWPITGGLPYDLSGWMDPREVERRFGTDRLLHGGQPGARRRARFIFPRLPRVDTVISHSTFMQQSVHASERWKHIPVRLVRLPVILGRGAVMNLDRAEAKRHFGLRPENPTVGFVAANMDSVYKGIPFGIQALNATQQKATVLVVGRCSPALRDAIQLPVVAPGYLHTAEELAAAYRAMDVLLFPSIAETFGLVAAEALACGTPVVAFKTTGVHDIVGNDERGLAVDLFDVKQMAAYVDYLLADRETAEKLGEKGRTWIEHTCTRQGYLNGTIAAYAEAQERWVAMSGQKDSGRC